MSDDNPDVVLRENDQVVSALSVAAHRGGVDLRLVPDLVKSVITRGCWQDRILISTGERVRFERFLDFVRTPPLEGMGCELSMLQRICAEDKQALDLLDRATQREAGAPAGNKNAASDKTTFDNVQGCMAGNAPTGNSRARALRRLREQRPDLHARVLAGELTSHAAAVEAGFRKRTVTVTATGEGFFNAILDHLDEEQQCELYANLAVLFEPDPAEVGGEEDRVEQDADVAAALAKHEAMMRELHPKVEARRERHRQAYEAAAGHAGGRT